MLRVFCCFPGPLSRNHSRVFGKGVSEKEFEVVRTLCSLAHQNCTIAIASNFRVDWAKSPEIPQKEGVLGSEIAAQNRKSLATFHCTLKSQCSIAFSCLRYRAISGVCDGHRNRKSQTSLRFRCTKLCSQVRSFSPLEQTRSTPRNFEIKCLFRTLRALGQGAWRKEFAQGTWPMFPGTSLVTCRTQKGYP